MITPTAGLRPLTGALLALALIVFGAPLSKSQVVLAQYQLFLSIVDGTGEPVTDLDPDEVVVQWDGMDCETLDLEPINLPVRVTVLIDNGEGARYSLQDMRIGLEGFVDALPEDVEVALITLGRQPRWVTRHTADRAELARGLGLVVLDLGAPRYLDGMREEVGRIIDDEERQYLPVLVMIATDTGDASTITQTRYADMRQKMVNSAVTVHTRIFMGQGNAGVAHAQMGIELGNLTRGSYEALAVANALRRTLPELGQLIARKHKRVKNQYLVTYAPPDGASDQPAISIGTTRQGLQLIPTIDGNVHVP